MLFVSMFLHNHACMVSKLILSYFLIGMKEFEATWIGWAGIDVPDKIGQEALTKALAKKVQNQSWLHHEIFINMFLLKIIQINLESN